jgi:tetraacyldisaccharide 4'-kinase
VGRVERSWSGVDGAVPWTQVLLPAAAVYGVASAWSRARAARERRSIPGLRVVSIGALTVGGAGKTSLARWLAGEAAARGARPAVLLGGHGRARREDRPFVVPDFEDYPLRSACDRAGDEAAAHRSALPIGATVASDRNRRRAAGVAASGYGATLAILDDGWEQGTLQWDEVWVAVDPRAPVGNGSGIPAGPLRRPPSTLREAAVMAFVLDETGEGLTRETLAWASAAAPAAAVLRFRRLLVGISEVGGRAIERWDPGRSAAILSGVGSPERLTRFARSAGIEVVSHDAYPDHARWSAAELEGPLRAAARAGAAIALITEKDEPRWPAGVDSPIPVRVLRHALKPVDPVDALLERVLAPAAPGRAAEGALAR